MNMKLMQCKLTFCALQLNSISLAFSSVCAPKPGTASVYNEI